MLPPLCMHTPLCSHQVVHHLLNPEEELVVKTRPAGNDGLEEDGKAGMAGDNDG